MCAQQQTHFTLWTIGRQQLEVTFDPGPIVCDAGLLAIRALERPLGILADLAARLPDPRAPPFVHHSTERLLTQQVYQVLAGYPDCNDADQLRHDALFQILAEVTPDGEQPLACGSTLARFQYASTRRGQQEGEREILLVRRAAQRERIKRLSDFLLDLFLRTRVTPPTAITLDVDATRRSNPRPGRPDLRRARLPHRPVQVPQEVWPGRGHPPGSRGCPEASGQGRRRPGGAAAPPLPSPRSEGPVWVPFVRAVCGCVYRFVKDCVLGRGWLFFTPKGWHCPAQG